MLFLAFLKINTYIYLERKKAGKYDWCIFLLLLFKGIEGQMKADEVKQISISFLLHILQDEINCKIEQNKINKYI